jgi:hypothetical protein
MTRLIANLIRAGLEPPARWLGLAGLAVVICVLVLPPLAAFAPAWDIPAIIALAAWLGMAATQLESEAYRSFRYQVLDRDPVMVRAIERRDALASGLRLLEPGAVRGHVEAMLQRIDDEVMPELEIRARRHRVLTASLDQLKQGRGPLVGANAERIAALQHLADEQRKALDGLVARLSDLNANVMGLANETDQSQLATQTREWTEELDAYWKATAEVFRPGAVPAGA